MTTAATGTPDAAAPQSPFVIGQEPAPLPVASRRRKRGGSLPYLLVLPSVLVMAGVLGFPLVKLLDLSTRKYGLGELIRRVPGASVGLDNYRTIVGDPFFRSVALRTILFATVCVALTMLIGTLIALLMQALSQRMRTLVSVGLLCAWAVPAITATIIWKWLFESEFGVVNWVLTALGVGDYYGHGWFLETSTAFAVIAAVVVWMSVPFVALTLRAGLTQIPDELYEAAAIDGANAWRMFRSVTFPMLKPVFMILATLSTIWDFRVFTQVWIMTRGGPSKGTYTIGVYAYIESFAASRFGSAAAMAVVMVAILLVVTAVYIRSLFKDTGQDIA
jgi:N,N'-diacetylchitobiose transport system permease protein